MIKKIVILSISVLQFTVFFPSGVRPTKTSTLRAKQVRTAEPKTVEMNIFKEVKSPKRQDGGEKLQPSEVSEIGLDQKNEILKTSIQELVALESTDVIDKREQGLLAEEASLEKEKAAHLRQLQILNELSFLGKEESGRRINLEQERQATMSRLKSMKKGLSAKKQTWGEYFQNIYHAVLGKKNTSGVVNLDDLSDED